jgi:serine phosphatase RsbU (regulator of sigma subunit)
MTRPTGQDTKPRPVILIVDDEPIVTQSLRAFLELETDYQVLPFQSPREALGRLRESPVDAVIADFLMPELDGLRFLTEVKRLYPDVPRILLTGYADKENAIKAINTIGLFQYIEKPWDNEHLILVLKNAIANKSLKEAVEDRIQELDRIMLEKEKLAEKHDLLSEELSCAQRLQQSLLPQESPDAGRLTLTAKYHPALDIGGDFYDIIRLANDELAVLIADATGHGIQAALSTAILKFSFSNFAGSHAGPGDIIAGMNRVLHKGLPDEVFVAAMVVVADTHARRCRVVNAGIPHPFILRSAGRGVERVIANGFMLGILEDELYRLEEETVFSFESGDVLFLYTDGLGEIENIDGEHFDQNMFKRLLTKHAGTSVEETAGMLVASGRQFAGTDHMWDDLTVMGIQFR